MPELVKVSPGMLDEVHRDLLHAMNPRMPLDSWRRLFRPGWDSGQDHVGYALRTADTLVGFAAYLYSVPHVGESQRRVCNLSTWVVDPAFRSQAMRLVMPVLKQKDLIVTNLTAVKSVHDIFSGLGFRVLESHLRVHRLAVSAAGTGTSVLFGDDIPVDRLTATDAAVHRSHREVAHSALIETPQGSCFVLFTVGTRRRLRTVRLHHISPADGLIHGLRAWQWAVFRRHGALFVEYDRRLAIGAPRPFSDIALSNTRLYRAEGVPPESISNAYSETVLLNI